MSGLLLVLGRNGQLARALAEAGPAGFGRVVCAGRAQANLSVPGAAARLIQQLAPRAVINAAAWTAVDAAETEEEAAWRINAEAAGEAAHAARRIGARFIQVSTDYVFGGDDREGPFAEGAEPAPVNAYGRTKLAGEKRVLQAHPEAAVVRTSAVFSGRGADFPSAMWRLAAERDAIDVVDDQLTGPTPAADLADAVLALAGQRDAAGVFHACGEPHVSWARFAEAALAVSAAAGGPDAGIRPVSSAAFPRPAARPADSRLGGRRLTDATGLRPPDWRKGLAAAFETWRRTR
ncbi:MAG: dTDP-4-dehydrorhamnose reductase [Alphaproteobacteria bacterium]|nr:dTDP-4-dehydrorhamnose reductase [Alphaproteobacteria bacterium]